MTCLSGAVAPADSLPTPNTQAGPEETRTISQIHQLEAPEPKKFSFYEPLSLGDGEFFGITMATDT